MVASVILLILSASFGCADKKAAVRPEPELGPVKLLKAGAEPRQAARYVIAPETTVRAVLDVVVATTSTEQVDDQFGVLPGLRLSLHLGPTVPIRDGVRYVLRIERAQSVVPENTAGHLVEHVEGSVAALKNMRGRFDVNEEGIVIDSKVPWTQAQDRIHPRVAVMLSNIRSVMAVLPLPEQPIGVGAVWEVRRPLRIWSMRLTQVSTYELLERTGERLRVGVTVRQDASPQVADLNPKEEVHVKSYRMRARGHALVDLSQPLTVEAQAKSESSADFVLVTPTKSEPVQTKQATVVRLVTKH